MFELKPISSESIPAALEKAKCYRFLNEPAEAESICLDILATDPDNQDALMTLILALTDQFKSELNQPFTRARERLSQLSDQYCRNYHEGIVCERRARAHLNMSTPGSGHLAHDWLLKAMACYQKAIDVRLAGNDDAILRWNACARIITNNPQVQPADAQAGEQMLE